MFFISQAGAVPQKINYEGRLTDAAGSALTGSYNLRFTITSDPGGSSAVWGPETHSGVTVTSGVFSVILGETTALTSSVFSSDTSYLKIEIANPPTSSNYEVLSPATQIVSIGYAFRAAVADALSGAGTPEVNYDNSTIDLNASSSLEVKDSGITAAKLASNAAVLTFAKQGDTRLTGDIDIKPGANITLNQSGSTIEIVSAITGGAGGWISGGGFVTLENASDYVGIGIATPEAGLDVQTAVKGSGNLYGARLQQTITSTGGFLPRLYGLEIAPTFVKGMDIGLDVTVAGNATGIQSNSDQGGAIEGSSNDGVGVYGYSLNNNAIYGESENGGGVSGYSDYGDAVTGYSYYGNGGHFSSYYGYGLLVDAGNVGIGTLTPSYTLDVSGSTRITKMLTTESAVYFPNIKTGLGTSLVLTTGGQVVASSSSLRYKHDIRDYECDTGKINELKAVRFKWNENTASPNAEDFGLIAEDVYKVYPELVVLDAGGRIESVKYEKLSVILLKVIQEQQKEINDLKQSVRGLKEKLK